MPPLGARRTPHRRWSRHAARSVLLAAILLPLMVLSNGPITTALAAPTTSARLEDQLDQLNREADQLVEQYNQSKETLARTRRSLKDLRAQLAKMPADDRSMGERIHEIVSNAAPALVPKTYYGMPAYAKDDKVVCFFQSAQKFRSRYATFGFNDTANLDDGTMWPTAFALTELTAADEARIGALVKRAVS